LPKSAAALALGAEALEAQGMVAVGLDDAAMAESRLPVPTRLTETAAFL
jgi:hypothetical protein